MPQDASMRIRLIPALLLFSVSALFAGITPATSAASPAAISNAAGMTDLRAGDLRAAEARFRLAVSVATSTLGESHPDTAFYQTNLALALLMERQFGRAEVLLHRVRYIVESAPSPDPVRLAAVLAELASAEAAQNEFSRAEADAQLSVDLVSRTNSPATFEVAVEKVMLATIYIREKKIEAAQMILPDAIALERRLAAQSPAIDRRDLACGIRGLAQLRELQHRWSEARTLFSEAIATFESAAGPHHPAMASMLLEYARVLKRSGASHAAVKAVEARARALKA